MEVSIGKGRRAQVAAVGAERKADEGRWRLRLPPPFLAGGLIALCLAAAVLLYFVPALHRLEATKATLARLEGELARDRETVRRLPQTRVALSRTQAALKVKEAGLPPGGSFTLPVVLRELTALAGQGGVQMVGFTPGGNKPRPDLPIYAEQELKLTVVGDYPRLIAFLQALTASRCPFRVEGFSLQREPAGTGEGASASRISQGDSVGKESPPTLLAGEGYRLKATLDLVALTWAASGGEGEGRK